LQAAGEVPEEQEQVSFTDTFLLDLSQARTDVLCDELLVRVKRLPQTHFTIMAESTLLLLKMKPELCKTFGYESQRGGV
jgi:hypothetical protein